VKCKRMIGRVRRNVQGKLDEGREELERRRSKNEEQKLNEGREELEEKDRMKIGIRMEDEIN
jgi:hypothetical protein